MFKLSRRLPIKLPSFSIDKALDRTAPAHLRGLYKVEQEQARKAEDKERAEAKIAADKKKDPLKNKIATNSSAGERGFVRGPGFGRNKPGVPSFSLSTADPAKSQKKYEVQWGEELDADGKSTHSTAGAGAGGGGAASSEPESLGDKIGSNLAGFTQRHQQRSAAAAAAAQAEVDEEADVLNALSSKGRAGAAGGAGAVELGPDGRPKKKKQPPGLFKRFFSTFSLGREDASAVRADEDEPLTEEMSEDKLHTGKYFKKLHAASLKSWTKQCFQRLESVMDLTLVSVEVETNPETDVVTVFVCADGGFDDKRLGEVKKWVESICPVTKARIKLIDQMEAEDRTYSGHVLATPDKKKQGKLRVDPLRQFEKRKNIRWIRVDPDK